LPIGTRDMEEKSKQPFQILEKTGQLLPEDYLRLRQLARFKLQQFGPSQSIQATDLAHLAWLRLESRDRWREKEHFFAYASVVMRNILVDRARKRSRQLPMADIDSHMLEQIQTAEDCGDPQILAIHEVLQQLEKDHPEVGKMLQMRFFVGMNNQEIATATGISERTIQRKVTFGRAYLARKLQSPSPFTEAS
jgi:RNA polymerase sigma factor (TIGR02999 family)